ncbi:MAG: ParB/RepB/Spo0J family partition protein [Sphingomonas sp.]
MTVTTLPLDQLEVSPLNVRKNAADCEPNPSLIASIEADGIRMPLSVHQLATGKYGAHAGGRRLRSARILAERGAVPADWPIPVQDRTGWSDAQLIEESIEENIRKRDLQPHEVYAGIAAASRAGHTIRQIADAIGLDDTEVKRGLRLGLLAPPIFDALAAGRLTLAQAKAYAATEDHDLQLAAFHELDRLANWEKSPERIRARLGVGDRDQDRMLRFVGLDAYRAAGGAFELDLFADIEGDRGRVAHPEILRGLVDQGLAFARDQIRAKAGRPDLRFLIEPPQNDFGVDYALQVQPKFERDLIVLPDGEVAAHQAIDENGRPDLTFWWPSRRAKEAAAQPTPRATEPAAARPDARVRAYSNTGLRPGIAINDAASPGEQRVADTAIKEEVGIGQDKVQVFRNLRQKILQALLVESAERSESFAVDWLIWSQLRLALGSEHRSVIGTNYLGRDRSAGAGLGRDLVRATPAHRVVERGIDELRNRPCLNDPDLGAAFVHFTGESERIKQLAAAIVAGLELERSLNADGYRLPTHDSLAWLLCGDDPEHLRKLWEPTADFLDLLPTRERLAIAEPFVEAAEFATWSRLKSADLTRSVLSALTGTARFLRRKMREEALAWIHPLLRFGPDDSDVNDAAAAAVELEGAE